MPVAEHRFSRLRAALDPRRSLAASIGWLVVVLSLGLAGVAGFWAGELTRDSLLEQRAERAANAAAQWSDGLDAVLAQRHQPLRTAAAMVPPAVAAADTQRLGLVFADLQLRYPELVWIGLADSHGTLLASTPAHPAGSLVSDQPWFRHGLLQPWAGVMEPPAAPAGANTSANTLERVVVFAVPVQDAQGRSIGVVAAHLDWAWFRSAAAALQQNIPLLAHGQALLLDASGRVLIAPSHLLGKTMPEGAQGGVASLAPAPDPAGNLHALGWRVRLQWSADDVAHQANAARRHVVLICLALGALAALISIGLAHRLTRRLGRLTDAVQAVDAHTRQGIAVPPGRDEVSHLGYAFQALLNALRTERDALAALSAGLELRVQERTREVERLAEEARYAAVVRERLRLARDLHDTLAHSMMAMLAEVRILRQLHVHDPQALAAELEHAEQTARAGLNEARAAITQMRSHGVRDLGLGAALADAISQFTQRSGLPVAYHADPQAAHFAQTRAETVIRIAEEALRNIEQHAAATHVTVDLTDADGGGLLLTITDDGVGFDPGAARPGHFGLVGLREQAHLVEATLHIDSAVGQGSRLSLRLRS